MGCVLHSAANELQPVMRNPLNLVGVGTVNLLLAGFGYQTSNSFDGHLRLHAFCDRMATAWMLA